MTLTRSHSIAKILPLAAATVFAFAVGCSDDGGSGGGGGGASGAGEAGEPNAEGGKTATAGKGGMGGAATAGGPSAGGAAGELEAGDGGQPATPEPGWSHDFALPGVNGATTSTVASVIITGTRKLWVGGEFSQAGDVPAQNVAIWNGQRWSAPGEGLSEVVTQLVATPAEEIYALVRADEGQSPLRFWNGTKWSSVGAIADGAINAIDVAADGTLYAGGTFTTIAGVSAPGIASRAPGKDWKALPSDVDVFGGGGIETVKVVSTGVCVGGVVGGGQIGVACLAGNTWTSRIANLSFGQVHKLTLSGGKLYAAGNFMVEGVDSGGGLAVWNGTSWDLVGGGLLGEFGQPDVFDVAIDGDKVYAAGFFALAGGAFVRHTAMWNGKKWSDLNGGLQKFMGVDFIEQARGRTLAIDDGGEVYVGGRLTFAGAENALRIARWDGADWHGVDDPLATRLGVNGNLSTVYAASDGSVYAAGGFEHLGGDALALGVARLVPGEKRWYPLGSGLFNVDTLTEHGGDVFAGGAFTASGTSNIKGVARWDGAAWRSVGGGVLGEAQILVDGPDGKLYAGGTFSEAGGQEVRNVAVWNDKAWSALGSIGEESDSVRALGFDADGALYAGGSFAGASESPANNVAVWRNKTWQALGAGVDDAVESIALYDGKIVIGGTFSHSGDQEVPHVAAWNADSETWEALGGGLPAQEEFGTVLVQALAVHGKDLYAAGLIQSAGGKAASHLVRFDGKTWHDVDGGVDDVAEGLSLRADALWIAGTFTRAGGVGSVGIARFGLSP